MLRHLTLALVACFTAPAYASYVYELTGRIEAIQDGESVADVLHVGDSFRAKFEYYSTPGAASAPGYCTDQASLAPSFDFGHVQILGGSGGGCMTDGIARFYPSLIGTNGLTGWGDNGSIQGWRFPFGTSLFPDDIPDQVWYDTLIRVKLGGPAGAASPVIIYTLAFDQIVHRRVPEPSTLALLTIGALGASRLRRR